MDRISLARHFHLSCCNIVMPFSGVSSGFSYSKELKYDVNNNLLHKMWEESNVQSFYCGHLLCTYALFKAMNQKHLSVFTFVKLSVLFLRNNQNRYVLIHHFSIIFLINNSFSQFYIKTSENNPFTNLLVFLCAPRFHIIVSGSFMQLCLLRFCVSFLF